MAQLTSTPERIFVGQLAPLPETRSRVTDQLAQTPVELLRSPHRVLLAALGLGVAVDALFYGKMLGLSLLVFVLVALAAVLWLGKGEGMLPRRRSLWLLAPLLFFSAMVAVRANGFLTLLNVLATLALLAVFAYFYGGGRIERLGLLGYPALLVRAIGATLVKAAPLLPIGRELLPAGGRARRDLLPVVRGLLLAAPVLLIFSTLLAAADAVFARYLFGLLRLDLLPSLPELIWRLVLVLAAGWMIGGVLVDLFTRHRAATGEPELEDLLGEVPKGFNLGFVEAATILVLVDLLFMAFGAIQFAYLFGGHENISVGGYTYAEYARRGFFELVAVSILSLGLILALNAIAWRESSRERLLFNALSCFMVGLVLLLLASALRRTLLYEEAYGLTHLRLYVHVFMLWLAAALLWFAIAVWLRPYRFAIGAFVCALGFLATLNVVNPDAAIAEQNLARHAAGSRLDAYYVSRLSEDAVPLLLRHLPALPDAERAVVRSALAGRLEYLDLNTWWRDWPSLNFSRSTAYDLLSAHRHLLAVPPETATTRE